MICEIRQTMWLDTPKGQGRAKFVIDAGDEIRARLIAAAPELLEALENISESYNPLNRRQERLLDIAYQIKTKARGMI